MANFVYSSKRLRNKAGMLFRLRNVEGYGWELHSIEDKDEDILIAFYGGFSTHGAAVIAMDEGKPVYLEKDRPKRRVRVG